MRASVGPPGPGLRTLPLAKPKLYTDGMPSQPRPWIFASSDRDLTSVAAAVSRDYLTDEPVIVERLIAGLDVSDHFRHEVERAAIDLVEKMRRNGQHGSGLDAFMAEYDLSSAEGIALMCLAEALLRIPDAATADKLIAEKLGEADWQAHLGSGAPLFVNASTWALMLTGRLLHRDVEEPGWIAEVAQAMNRLGEPVIRTALRHAMRPCVARARAPVRCIDTPSTCSEKPHRRQPMRGATSMHTSRRFPRSAGSARRAASSWKRRASR
jgi:hypothetical protein